MLIPFTATSLSKHQMLKELKRVQHVVADLVCPNSKLLPGAILSQLKIAHCLLLDIITIESQMSGEA